MKESAFDLILGRHHSGRTIQAITMAARRAKSENKQLAIYTTPEAIEYAKSIAAPIAKANDTLWTVEDFNILPTVPGDPACFVICVLADEISHASEVQARLCDCIRKGSKNNVPMVVSLPALLGRRDDLKLTIEARAMMNCAPVGSRVHLTSVDRHPTSGALMKIDLIGKTFPFSI